MNVLMVTSVTLMLPVPTPLVDSLVNARKVMKEMEKLALVLNSIFPSQILNNYVDYYSDIDIDECAVDSDKCDPNAICTNTPGGFTCRCKKGYRGNGITCTGNIM